MADLTALLDDLDAEAASLDALVADLDAAGWGTDTPAEGWTVAHQVAHLHWTDEVSVLAATDADAFRARAEQAFSVHGADAVDVLATEGASRPPAQLLTAWREGRRRLRAALEAVPAGERLPWFGPPMAATSMATARLMETWAHGQDVADALGVSRTPTSRLRHVAHIAVRARGFAYTANQLAAPDEPIRVELTGPHGDRWDWGPDDAAQRVTGDALGFCLLAVQRRHRDDVDLTAEGPDAERWLGILQAFAGPPGPGRQPLGT